MSDAESLEGSDRETKETLKGYEWLKDERGAVAFLTYNRFGNLGPGAHADGRVRIYDGESVSAGHDAKKIAEAVIEQFYNDFRPLREHSDEIAQVFVYSGLSAWEEMLRAAQSINHDLRGKTTLTTCSCHYDEKKDTAEACRIPLIKDFCTRDIAKMIVDHYTAASGK